MRYSGGGPCTPRGLCSGLSQHTAPYPGTIPWLQHHTLADVVDLPDILLPAGQYLDLFDSESETDVPSDSSDEELVQV